MGVDIATIAGAIGDPARARMLLALMGGRALTATELAMEAEVAPSTTSAHLSRLVDAHLIRMNRQGRHRYFEIADPSVAALIESLCGVATGTTPKRVRTGPADPAIRRARICYDHLAGELAVALFESLIHRRWLVADDDAVVITEAGASALSDLGVDIPALRRSRRPMCRQCLDWSVRRHHLAGAVGAAILDTILQRRWAQRDLVTRAVHFTPAGQRQFERAFRHEAAEWRFEARN